MAPIKLRKQPPPTSKELVEELDKLVDDFKQTLLQLKELFEEDDEQEKPSG